MRPKVGPARENEAGKGVGAGSPPPPWRRGDYQGASIDCASNKTRVDEGRGRINISACALQGLAALSEKRRTGTETVVPTRMPVVAAILSLAPHERPVLVVPEDHSYERIDASSTEKNGSQYDFPRRGHGPQASGVRPHTSPSSRADTRGRILFWARVVQRKEWFLLVTLSDCARNRVSVPPCQLARRS